MKDSFFVNKRSRGGSGNGNASERNTKTGASSQRRIGNPRKIANPTARRSTIKSTSGVGNKRQRSSGNESNDDSANDSDDNADLGAVDDMDLVGDRDKRIVDSDDETNNVDGRETAAMKRLRLAKKYIAKIKGEEEEMAPTEFDAQDIDSDLIAERLRDDVLQSKGKVYHKMANRLKDLDLNSEGRIRTFGGRKVHQLALTCVDVVSEDAAAGAGGVFIYSASKDGHIVKWDFSSGKKIHEFLGNRKITKKALKAFGEAKLKKNVGHRDQVLTLAISGDGKFLHRDAVSGLSFRYGTRSNQLYSCSYDRTIKLWNVDELSYIETLFGHQDRIESIDSLAYERCLTAGSRDRSVRLWKIVEESQLIFRGGGGGATEDDLKREVSDGILLASEVEQAKKDAKRQGASKFGTCIDVIAMLDEEHFISGTDNGVISLWNTGKKKPVFSRVQTHGTPKSSTTSTVAAASCNWITSIAVVRYSDLFASGSCDGFIRFWQVDKDKRSFQQTFEIPMIGFINSMRFFEAPTLLRTNTTEENMVIDQDEVELNPSAAKREAARKRATKGAPNNVLYLALATGQEHRLGRWWKVKEAKNQLHVITLS
ncbi:pre-rRNA processing protein [Physocladia obscura]|uniref:Pre-rRNA processing protein n=1 Tax=Physocladia obscura TaxID=109957 RepID=A0AAD5X913_9FUNG|nr:pre-rRNA processing protein [Physocladia obscura]